MESKENILFYILMMKPVNASSSKANRIIRRIPGLHYVVFIHASLPPKTFHIFKCALGQDLMFTLQNDIMLDKLLLNSIYELLINLINYLESGSMIPNTSYIFQKRIESKYKHQNWMTSIDNSKVQKLISMHCWKFVCFLKFSHTSVKSIIFENVSDLAT